MNANRFQIISPRDLPDYRDLAGDLSVASWPEFMLHDPIANENWHELFDRFHEYQFGLFDTQNERLAAIGNSLPFYWDRPLEELPEQGWDWVLLEAVRLHEQGVQPNIQSAIQINIHPDYRSQGLSTTMVKAMRAIGQSEGFKQLVAPVRRSEERRVGKEWRSG